MLELWPPACMGINPCRVGLVVCSNIIEVNGLREAFPEAGILDGHGPSRARESGCGLVETDCDLGESPQALTGQKHPGPEACPRRFGYFIFFWRVRFCWVSNDYYSWGAFHGCDAVISSNKEKDDDR